MGETFGLTASQRNMFDAEHLQDDYSVVVAHHLDITDVDRRFDHELFRAGVIAGARVLETAYSRFSLVDGHPVQYIDPGVPFDVHTVDMRAEPDPLAAAHDWMRADHEALMDVTADQMAVSAFLRVADDRTLWYLRGHHIAFDGFAALTCLHEAVDRYNASSRGETYEVAPRATVAEVVADDEKYRDSSRRVADAEYWAERVAGLPERVSLAQSPASGRLAPHHEVRSMVMPADDQRRLDERAAEFGASSAAVLGAAFAAYLAVTTDRDDIVLSLPVTGRATAKIKRAGGMVANMLPVRLDGVLTHTGRDLVAAVTLELTGCLRRQRYRFEDIAERAGLADTVTSFGPIVNLVFFDKPLALDGARVSYHILSSGILDDLRVNLYQAGAGLPIVVDLHGNSTMYSGAEIDHHLAGFGDLLHDFLDRPESAVRDLGARTRT